MSLTYLLPNLLSTSKPEGISSREFKLLEKAKKQEEIAWEQKMAEGWENVGSASSDTSDSSFYDGSSDDSESSSPSTDRGNCRKRKRSPSPQLPPSYMLKEKFQESSSLTASSLLHQI